MIDLNTMLIRAVTVKAFCRSSPVSEEGLAFVGSVPTIRGLPAGACDADRAPDAASHRLKHHLNRYPVPEWIHQQIYLNPYPKEFMLRNHV
jgi:hypothetical protein